MNTKSSDKLTVKFRLRMFKKRNRSRWIGKVRVEGDDTAKAIPFTDFCDLSNKVKKLMKGK